MAGVVRELVTLWGFDIDKKPLQELDAGINTIKGSLKAVGIAIGTVTAGIGFLLNRAGGEEQTMIAFETMLGSMERAKELMTDIKQFADVTPFNTEEVVQASKGLLAFGVAQEDIIDKTRVLGDIASGVGKDKFGTLIRGFGKIKTKGKATMEELNMFLEAGVPILDELAKNMGVTKEEIFKMVSTGKVGFKEVDQALKSMATGSGKFAGLMAKQSKSFFGLISTIQGQLDNFAKEIGNELLPLAKEITSGFLEWFEANKKLIRSQALKFVKILVEFLGDLVDLVVTFSKALNGLVQLFGGWNTVLNRTFKIFTAIMGLGLLAGIGLITKAIIGLALAWKTMGAAALFAQIKMALIPIAIGAIVTAIALIAEDIIAFTQGRDSVFGRMINGLDEIFASIKEKFGIFGDIGQFIITALLTPIRSVINIFKSLIDMFDVLRGKISIMQGLKNIAGNIGNVFGFNGAQDGLSGALGISNAVNSANATAAAKANPGGIPGLGTTPFKTAAGGENAANSKVEQTLNLNVTGMDPEAAKELVSGKIKEEMGGMFRSAVRDGESQVER